MGKPIVTLIGAAIMAMMVSTMSLAQGAGSGSAASGEGTSSGQAGRSGDRPGK